MHADLQRDIALVVSASVLVVGCVSADAAEAQGVLDDWGVPFSKVENCAGTLGGSDNELSTTVGCVSNQMFAGLMEVAFQFGDKYGKSLFGRHFQIERRLDFSPSAGGISGDLDAVIPMNSFTSASGDLVTRALFLQNGLTRWRDEHGHQRNDARLGLVHRTATSMRPDAAVFGTSVFLQENLERGHGRIVTGLDYSDKWGRGSLSYFIPITDWRAGRFGYEERALEGLEFEFGSEVTRTIKLEAAAGRWESEDGSGDWLTRGRLAVRWQPHPWFGLRGNWDDIGTPDDSLGLHAVIELPFGGSERMRARWRGLGLTELDSSAPDTNAIWNVVTSVQRINLNERAASPAESSTSDSTSPVTGANVQFLPVLKKNRR